MPICNILTVTNAKRWKSIPCWLFTVLSLNKTRMNISDILCHGEEPQAAGAGAINNNM